MALFSVGMVRVESVIVGCWCGIIQSVAEYHWDGWWNELPENAFDEDDIKQVILIMGGCEENAEPGRELQLNFLFHLVKYHKPII